MQQAGSHAILQSMFLNALSATNPAAFSAPTRRRSPAVAGGMCRCGEHYLQFDYERGLKLDRILIWYTQLTREPENLRDR